MTTHDLTHINYKCISIMYKCLCEVCIANKINLSLKWCIPQNCKTHLTDTFNFFRLSCYLGEIKNLYFLSVSVCFIVLFCQHLVTERLLSREYLRNGLGIVRHLSQTKNTWDIQSWICFDSLSTTDLYIQFSINIKV